MILRKNHSSSYIEAFADNLKSVEIIGNRSNTNNGHGLRYTLYLHGLNKTFSFSIDSVSVH